MASKQGPVGSLDFRIISSKDKEVMGGLLNKCDEGPDNHVALQLLDVLVWCLDTPFSSFSHFVSTKSSKFFKLQMLIST